jgi:hypothetical protein
MMKQSLRLLPLFLVLILAGCADNETPAPRKKRGAATVTDSQEITTLTSTNGVPLVDGSVTDTNSAVTNAISSPANPFATPTPVPVAAPRDLPYGTPVPGKPGFVTSPHSPTAGYVDVRGFPPGSEVKDPYSGKVFLVP